MEPVIEQAVPRNRCDRCGEYLPHYCAALVELGLYKGVWSVTITDRDPRALRARNRQLVQELSTDAHHIGFPGGLPACYCGFGLGGGNASERFIDHVLALREETHDRI